MSNSTNADMAAPCRVCGQTAVRIFNKLLLGKYNAAYFKCSACGHVQTEQPYWLKEAYGEMNSMLDVGMAGRCLWTAELAVALALRLGVQPDESCLDWGAGTGLFVRLCRDYGLNFFYSDPYATNIFARGFEWQEGAAQPAWAMLTAFEVAEHLADPLSDFGKLFERSPRCILFSTLLYEGQNADWWYFVDNGQHVAFYTRASLEHIARHYGYHLVSNNRDLHIFSQKRLPDRLVKSCCKAKERLARRYCKKYGSRTLSDFDYIKTQLKY
jgi:hypothetical protein